MSSGIADGMAEEIMGKAVVCVIVCAEGKLKYFHAREAAVTKKLTYVIGEEAKVLGNDGAVRKVFFNNAEKVHSRAFFPFAVSCGVFAEGDAVISGKSAGVVNTEDIIFFAAGAKSCYPPFIAAFFVVIPVINGVAPKLAVFGKSVRRATCNTAGAAIFVKIKELGVCPNVAAVVRNINGKVTDDFYSADIGIFLEILPLAAELVLEELPKSDFLLMAFNEFFKCGSFALIIWFFPFTPAFAAVSIFKGHKKCIFIEPAFFFFTISFKGVNVAFFHKVLICLAKNCKTVFVNMGIINIHGFGSPIKIFKILFFKISVHIEEIKVDEIGVACKG